MNLAIKLPSAAAWLAGAMLWATGAPAQAEDAAQSQDRPDRLVMVGLGPRIEPSYPGSSRTSIGVAPVVNAWSEDQPLPVETPDEGKGPTLLGTRNASAAGLTFAFAPQRGSETATQGLRKVGFGIEAGLFAESYVLPGVRLRAEARHAIGAHAALVGDAALDLVLRSKRNDRAMLTLGPRVRFGTRHRRLRVNLAAVPGRIRKRALNIPKKPMQRTALPTFAPELWPRDSPSHRKTLRHAVFPDRLQVARVLLPLPRQREREHIAP